MTHDDLVTSTGNENLQYALSKTYHEVSAHRCVCASISGGSDSDVMLDMISRVDGGLDKTTFIYFNTGLEYDATKRHLNELEAKYGIHIEWVPPVVPIPKCCSDYGIPFWSKRVSDYIHRLQRNGFQWEDGTLDELLMKYPHCKVALRWWCNDWPVSESGVDSKFNIRYQPYLKEFLMHNPPDFKISSMCCEKAKKEPAHRYQSTHDDYDLICTGVRKAEKGARAESYKSCFDSSFSGPDQLRPLFWLTDADKAEYKQTFGIINSDCYEVWGMHRTGCAGCPYGKSFEQELELMRQYEPKFYTVCMNVFGKSYEYTRQYLKFRNERKHTNG